MPSIKSQAKSVKAELFGSTAKIVYDAPYCALLAFDWLILDKSLVDGEVCESGTPS